MFRGVGHRCGVVEHHRRLGLAITIFRQQDRQEDICIAWGRTSCIAAGVVLAWRQDFFRSSTTRLLCMRRAETWVSGYLVPGRCFSFLINTLIVEVLFILELELLVLAARRLASLQHKPISRCLSTLWAQYRTGSMACVSEANYHSVHSCSPSII